MRGRTQSPPGARAGAGWLRGRTPHWRLDISTRWFAGGPEASVPGEGRRQKKCVGKSNKLSGGVFSSPTDLVDLWRHSPAFFPDGDFISPKFCIVSVRRVNRLMTTRRCALCGLQFKGKSSESSPCPSELPPRCAEYARGKTNAAGDPDVPEAAIVVSNLERPLDLKGARSMAQLYSSASITCPTHAGLLREVGVKGLVSHTDLSPLDLALPGAVRLVFGSEGQAEKALSALDSIRRGCLTTRAAYDKSHHRLHNSAGKQCRKQVSIEQEELRLNPTPVPTVTRHALPQAPPYVAPPKELRGHALPPLDEVLEAGLGVDMGYRTRSVAAAAAHPEPGAAEVEATEAAVAAEAAAVAEAAAAAEAAMADKSPGATPKTVPKPAPVKRKRAVLGSHTPYRHLNEEERKEHRALRAEALRAAHAGLTRWVQAVRKARLTAGQRRRRWISRRLTVVLEGLDTAHEEDTTLLHRGALVQLPERPHRRPREAHVRWVG